jgi:transposase
MSWRAVDVERLIGEDHPARAIWTLLGRLDLSSFYRGIESSIEEGGRPAFDPQLLISLWVYAYSQGIGSAREVARRCEFDPAFQWLTGLDEVNYHTLADFRVEKQKELDGLFTQVLAALSKEGLITLEQVMRDGTKIKALASTRSYPREGTIQGHLERARQRVAEMGDPRKEESSPKDAGLSRLCAQATVLPGKSEAWSFGHAPRRKRAARCFPAEGGYRRGSRTIPPPQPGGGVLTRVDQKQARSAAGSRARFGEGADGDAVGLSHLQPALDLPAQSPGSASRWMKS